MRRPRQPALTQSKGWLADQIHQVLSSVFFCLRVVGRAISAHHVPREILLDIKEKLFRVAETTRAWRLMVKRRAAERRSRISRTLHSIDQKLLKLRISHTSVCSGPKEIPKGRRARTLLFYLGRKAARSLCSCECFS